MEQTQASNSVRLTGLDGSNPLAFLAALGLLRVLEHRARVDASPRPRLSWVEDGHWQPLLHDAGDLDGVVAAVIADKRTWADDPALLLAYDERGERLLDPHLRVGARMTRDLKPKPGVMRLFLDRVAGLAEERAPDRPTWMRARRAMDTASAYGSEMVQDNNGNTKPLALHFTAGQQRFLEAAATLQEGVSEQDVREALEGPWTRASRLPSMSWDSTVSRMYALRATDPSGEKRGSTPGADWLAFVGLGLLLATPRGRQLRTTGVTGGWKDSVFTWPLWVPPAALPVARSLLATPRLADLTVSERVIRGIGVVFSSAITRSDQGGYGGFSPARVA